MKKFIKLWLLPILVSIGLFFVIRPILAQITGENISLSEYLISNDVEVGSESIDGYLQVYFIFNGQKKFITRGGINSSLPDSEGEFIVFRKSMSGVDQIFLYNILTEQTIQLTHSGNNTNPRIDQGKAVWEGSVDGIWHIFLFDGIKISQITSGDMAVNPDIEGDFVSFTRRDISGNWRAELYSISRKKSADVSTGDGTKRPKLSEGDILMLNEKGGVEKFALKVEDFFTLDLAPLLSDEPLIIAEEDILQELSSISDKSSESQSVEVQEATTSGQTQ